MNQTASPCCPGLPPAWCAPYLKPGDTYPLLTFAFTETDTEVPLNFPAGTTALAQIRDKRRNQLIFAFSVSVAANVITLAAVPAESTRTLPRGRHWFELQTTGPDGTVTSWVDSGEIVIGEDHANG